MGLHNIAVFCGSSIGFNNLYRDSAKELGEYFVQHKIGLVYGGAKIGLMGAISNTMIEQGGNVIGIIPGLLEKEEVINKEASEVYVTKTMSERKMKMSQMVEAYIALPGGYGTLDELFEVLTLQQLYIETKPVGILNVNGFFDHTIKQLDFMVEEGFLKPDNRKMLLVDETVNGLMEKIKNYKAPEKSNIINKVVR
ncbi:hypothetical protein SAMN04489761_1541 [Tenacibaculum sp. MAR_2009_124]|uniref:LOG family protein n=1 Tax=Tenacibaculum sp. MAR_2009_124 TaxID=1250059 RepID=UPI00089D312E|nr:TIGR00730 family Rossman fold protein [Tenacibaculum sp. MAR_2009_124]SEB71475.1 hypothetical protein SAMN04489761_1541 [Tenacibaculum sp. MAR_2009_124]